MSLFSAAGLEAEAPRPLADRLRPQTLAEVAGQDHIVGPTGALTRLLGGKTLGSLIFWGPPGTGKTTVARLLAGETKLAFVRSPRSSRAWPTSRKCSRRRDGGGRWTGHAALRR